MATQRARLMIPGPVDVEDEILEALAQPTLPHYGAVWMEIYRETVGHLRWLFGTVHDLFVMVGPGSTALDAALGSLMHTGDPVLIPSNGFFGRRMAAMARGYGLAVQALEGPLDRPIDPEAVRRALAQQPGVQALVVVHLETSTGVLNPLQEIAAAAREFDVPIVADAVSSLGGVPLPVDEWGIDVCVTVANKCLACPPGVALISIGPRAWAQIDRKGETGHGWVSSLRVWRDYATRWASWHPYPTTLPTNNIVALRAGLRRIRERGLEAQYRRFATAAESVRAGLRRLGLGLFGDEAHASPLITAVRGRPGLDVEDLRRFLLDDWQVMVAGGLDDLHGKIFRVGHIGKAASSEYVERLLAGLEAYPGIRP